MDTMATRVKKLEDNVQALDKHLVRTMDAVEKLDVLVAAIERSGNRQIIQDHVQAIVDERADREETQQLTALRASAEQRGLVLTTRVGKHSLVLVRFTNPQNKARKVLVLDMDLPTNQQLLGHEPDEVINNHRILLVYDPK